MSYKYSYLIGSSKYYSDNDFCPEVLLGSILRILESEVEEAAIHYKNV